MIRDEPSSDVIQRLLTGTADSSKLLSIPYLSARVACGAGRINEDYPEVLGRYEISEDFLAGLNLPLLNYKKIQLITNTFPLFSGFFIAY